MMETSSHKMFLLKTKNVVCSKNPLKNSTYCHVKNTITLKNINAFFEKIVLNFNMEICTSISPYYFFSRFGALSTCSKPEEAAEKIQYNLIIISIYSLGLLLCRVSTFLNLKKQLN